MSYQELRNILAFDTALNGCSAGIYAADGNCVSQTLPMTTGQAERLMPLIAEILSQAGLGMTDIGAVVTTFGPGAFTGLRIGLSAARGLALALGIPLFGISSLQAFASQYAGEGACLVLIDTKRNDFYVQSFESGEALSEPEILSASGAAERLADFPAAVIGDGAARFQKLFPDQKYVQSQANVIDAGFMAKLFADGRRVGIFQQDPQPLYLREANVSQPKTAPRTIEYSSKNNE